MHPAMHTYVYMYACIQIYSMIRIVYFAFNDKPLHINKQETVATLTLAGMPVVVGSGIWVWKIMFLYPPPLSSDQSRRWTLMAKFFE